ncbi:dTDP-4-amino-4,6-dideoxy-D-glucose transaminase [anaerobic digester metagenome]
MNKIKEPIYVTQPLLPDFDDLEPLIKDILHCKYVTNHGKNHNLLETLLLKVLKVNNVSLFNNGTIALLTALKALDLPEGSEVITTPFTFPATPHCIAWNGLKPVFCDIEPKNMTIDINKIEKLINSKTSAILPVHVYGFPCDINKIEKIATKNDLKVIYDGAHTFGTEVNGKAIGNFGDITMFSFHATKLFNTIEGGCLTYKNNDLREKIYNLRNFGIKNENEVVDVGINGKLNEFQASVGLLNLKLLKNEQIKRLKIKRLYVENLKDIDHIKIPEIPKNVTDSFQYFVIIIEDDFAITRDQLYDRLKEYNIFTRKYFYPLCSDYEPYKDYQSSSINNLPIANDLKNKVLCLPYYGSLDHQVVIKICNIIKDFSRKLY